MSYGVHASKGVFWDALQSVVDNPQTVVLTAVIGLVILFVADTLRVWYHLSHVPGPFLAGFSKAWMVKESFKGEQPYAIQKATEKYGGMPPSNVSCKLTDNLA
jgi:hypothetical protein